MDNFKVGIFADTNIGLEVIDFILFNHRDDLSFICVPSSDSDIIKRALDLGFNEKQIFIYNEFLEEEILKQIKQKEIDYFILAWWPYIVKENILNLPKCGTLNFHPSYLPYNRGKHPTFWNIIEEAPYGVSIHFVDTGIDSGDVVFQKKIAKTWEDTGKTLYDRAQKEMVKLFKQNYKNLKAKKYKINKQKLKNGSFHYSSEMANSIEVLLHKKYYAKDLFNLLRAKKFPNAPKCFFYDKDDKYEVEITIKKVKKTRIIK